MTKTRPERISLRVAVETVIAAGRFMSALNPQYEYGVQKQRASSPAATTTLVAMRDNIDSADYQEVN
jgi:hypothetical protein